MNTNQKRILAVMMVAVAGMLVYPPFHLIAKDGRILNMGYGWIFAPPEFGYFEPTVDVSMLLMQWVGVLVTGGIAVLLAKTSTSVSQPSDVPNQPSEGRQEIQERLGDDTVGFQEQPSVWVYAIHFIALALAVPLVKNGAGLDGAIPIVAGCALAVWLSKLTVGRIYALNITQSRRTTVLWLLPIAYVVLYVFLYYVLASVTR